MNKQTSLFDTEHREAIQKQIDELQQELEYDTRDYPISFLVDLYKDEDETVFAPDYQREELLWSLNMKSRFIESLILDYPIPLIFLADTQEGKLEIVDGLQRISTLADFLQDNFALAQLKKIDTLNGCSFEDLPNGEKRRLKSKSLRIIVLKKSTSDVTKRELFDRLNTSSLRASTSEVRSGREIDNGLMKLIINLTKNKYFIETTQLSDKRLNRKEDIELISRFFAYSYSLHNYNGKVVNFIDEFIASEGSSSEWSDTKRELYEKDFVRTMKFVNDNFDRGFMKEERNQTPRVRFEALAVGINLAIKENPDLKISKEKIQELLLCDDFKMWTTTDAANNKNKVISRIHGVRDFFLREQL
ncbi:DUF262 domain-containing protein [Enterococcus faecium]|uniref:DUF262 domain-containing protein n=1 Tax=Enterococcus TaxID=1350 RepID=UPI000F51276C|nr:DUF262 domain-containing protein [Enterococcus faecium]ROX63936.1 DUF262 domain-containing protein [Enterococcus faecium]ROX65868.1 DUF262 domain-containing protein [Enterococcus faecium]ROY25614.1 DUF262 domain-containing protein [Enterococcus faecium]ROY60388.1 DUF262 domain-containing protein [Enterococcus faecium]ROY76957.1 DUF262 domain-containing protein [Enterococcus faecium]